MGDLWVALCLVAVLEGLFLFVAPGAWKRAAQRLQAMPDRQLRVAGGAVLMAGLLALYFLRNA